MGLLYGRAGRLTAKNVFSKVFSTRDLMSDYKGDQQCAYEGADWKKHGGGDYGCFPTIAQARTVPSWPRSWANSSLW
jgi:hypothetical protein